MSNISTKIFGLAGAAMAFAGMAFGQATCGAPSAQTNIIRAEGTTEQVATLNFTCTSATALPGGLASAQLFLSPALPVTSKLLSSSSGATEAVIQVNFAGAQVNGTASTGTLGTVSGSTISFSGIALPPVPAANCGANFCYNFTVSNVRVNATSLSVGSGVPPAVSETVFISGSATSIVPSALASTQVAFAQNGLGAGVIYKTFTVGAAGFPNGAGSNSGANSFVICNAYSPKIDAAAAPARNVNGLGAVTAQSLAFVIRVAENTSTAFKSFANESSKVTTGTSNAVAEATRFAINFANVPSNVTLYVPAALLTSTNGSAATAQLTASAPGTAFAPTTGSSSSNITSGGAPFASGAGSGLTAVTVASGSGSAVFEIIGDDPNNLDRFDIPVFAVTSANTVAGSSTAITASVSLNPIGSTVIPNFAVSSATTTLTGSLFNLCTTSLLFPFVTNQLGFDTGLAISNTSTDPFSTTTQSGTCILNFYGAGAPSPANVTTPNVPTGTVFTQVLSGVAAGFQGYIIAQCGFQYAHGFAFITDGVGVNGGLSQGYLAGVIPDVNQTNGRAANSLDKAPAGSGEVLGN